MEWPDSHATTCVSGLIVGGRYCDCWIGDLTMEEGIVCILDTFKIGLIIHSSAIPP